MRKIGIQDCVWFWEDSCDYLIIFYGRDTLWDKHQTTWSEEFATHISPQQLLLVYDAVVLCADQKSIA